MKAPGPMHRPGSATIAIALVLGFVLALPAWAEQWQSPQMSWGVPDLQGTWTNATITGLVRFDEIEDLVLAFEDRALGDGRRL